MNIFAKISHLNFRVVGGQTSNNIGGVGIYAKGGFEGSKLLFKSTDSPGAFLLKSTEISNTRKGGENFVIIKIFSINTKPDMFERISQLDRSINNNRAWLRKSKNFFSVFFLESHQEGERLKVIVPLGGPDINKKC